MCLELGGSGSSNCLHMIKRCWVMCLLFVARLIIIQVSVFAIVASGLLEIEF